MAQFRATFQKQGANPFVEVNFTANPGSNLSTIAWKESTKENNFMTEENESASNNQSRWEIITIDYLN